MHLSNNFKTISISMCHTGWCVVNTVDLLRFEIASSTELVNCINLF